MRSFAQAADRGGRVGAANAQHEDGEHAGHDETEENIREEWYGWGARRIDGIEKDRGHRGRAEEHRNKVDRAQPSELPQLGAALAGFWGAGGYYAEMRRWLEQAVHHEHVRDGPELARCLTELAFSSHLTGDVARGIDHALASVEMWRRLDDQSGLPRTLGVLGELELERGQFDAARGLYEEYLTLARASGDSRLLLGALGTLANLELSERRYESALELFRQGVAIATELGDPVKLVVNQHNLACTLHRMGQFEKAATQMLDRVAQILRLNTPWMLIVFAEDYAATLAELGRYHQAARLLGAADAMRDRVGSKRPPTQQIYIDQPIAKARNAVTAEEWDTYYQAGHSMTVEQALAIPTTPTTE
jgi:tetratricopeptide (TPR) repeat protein